MGTNSSNSPSLYPGEHLDSIAGFPTLYKFSPADPEKPLIVFIPGAGHNARIAYGGHVGCQDEDFLTYWLNKLGHGVLAISYPLQSEPENIMPPVAPEFRISNWGPQAAETTKKIIERYFLPRKLLLLAWSMGGKIGVPYTAAAESLGLTVELFVALAATPGLAGARTPPPDIRQTSAGYGTFGKMHELFLEQVHEQCRLNDRIIIPDDIYCREYFGHTPVGLLSYNLRYSTDDGFVKDKYTSTEDAAAEKFQQWPIISVIHGDSILDARHALTDKATWAYLQSHKMFRFIGPQGPRHLQERGVWNKVVAMVHYLPEQMTSQIQGNHFFFLGEQGARETAHAILKHLECAREFQSTLESLLG